MGKEADPAGYRERVFKNYQDSCADALEIGSVHQRPDLDHLSYRAHYLRHLPQDKSARILDIACGAGNLLAFLKQEGYSGATGVDRSPQMAQMARGKGLKVERGDALEHLQSKPGSWDCVLAMDFLEHLYKDELVALLDAVHAALKPQGIFLAHTVNTDGISWGRMRHIDITHETAFTRYSLEQLFKVTGFSRCEFFPTGPLGRGPRAWLRKLIWQGFRLAAGLYYHIEMGSGILRNDHILSASLVAKAVKSGP